MKLKKYLFSFKLLSKIINQAFKLFHLLISFLLTLKFGRDVFDPLADLSRCFSWFISMANCCCCRAAAIVAAIVLPGGKAGRLIVPLSFEAAEPIHCLQNSRRY